MVWNRIKKDPSFWCFCFVLTALLLGLAYAYGVISHAKRWFPVPLIYSVGSQVRELLVGLTIFESREFADGEAPILSLHPQRLAPGLVMVVGSISGDRHTFIRIVNRDGEVIHEWLPQWSEIWGSDEGEFPEDRRPVGGAGAYIHGIELLPDGSFVANFEHLSTIRMDVCGDLMWKLDNLGHHAVHRSTEGDLWVTAEKYYESGPTGFPNHESPLRSWTLQKLDTNGKVLREIEIIDVLLKNDLSGLLYLSNVDNFTTEVSGDTLHLNDVDVFPDEWRSEVFDAGDLLVSLRNINTVLVFDPDTLKIKFISTGKVLRQHDPDFQPGDRITVFDNHNLQPTSEDLDSRIVELDARTGDGRTLLPGDGEDGFYTGIMGVHQVLENGNVLVTSSSEGRVLEYLPDNTLAWRYSNTISERQNGSIFIGMLLPPDMDADFFAEHAQSCKRNQAAPRAAVRSTRLPAAG